MTRVIVKKRRKQRHYSTEFKIKVLKDYIEHGLSRQEVCVKYDLCDPSILSHWVRNFGIDKSDIKKGTILMPSKVSKPDREVALEHRIRELEKLVKAQDQELALGKLRHRALDQLIDVAEETLRISIRKKPGTKQ
jgi:transposase-like protein